MSSTTPSGSGGGGCRRGPGRDGRLFAVGFASGSWPDIDPHQLVVIQHVIGRGVRRRILVADLERIHAQLSELVGQGLLRNAVTATFAFDELPRALQGLADHAVVGKRVLDVPTLTAHPGA